MKRNQPAEEDDRIPLLLTFLFGDAAKAAQQGASERLLLWCQAYEDWLAERKRTRCLGVAKRSVTNWRRLVKQVRKPPWELTPADIEQYTAWMQAQGYKNATIVESIGVCSNFYRWCGEHRVDPRCKADFNPAAKVDRPRFGLYQGARLLSREEIERLLEVIKRDSSVLGKRDYAFILARLRFGVPLHSLEQLKWGQIDHDQEGAWVRWKPEADWQRMPDEVWQAIRSSLEAGSRLASIRASHYIFAPLARPYEEETGSKAEDWRAEKHLSWDQFRFGFLLYCRLAGIDQHRLNLTSLRLTAIRMKLDRGASLEEMWVFMGCREKLFQTKHRLGKLPPLPPDQVWFGTGVEVRLPLRKAKRLKPGDGLTHGFYASSQPPEAVAAILKEGVQGIGEELVDMRLLARRLLEKQGTVRSSREAVQLGETYTKMASRIGEMIKAEKELAERGSSSQWAEEVLSMLDRLAIAKGEEPISDQLRKDALGGDLNLEATARRLVEEIASTRRVLRSSFQLAMEAQETQTLMHMAEIFGACCIRLVRLLKFEKSNSGQLEAYLKEGLDKALETVAKQLGLSV